MVITILTQPVAFLCARGVGSSVARLEIGRRGRTRNESVRWGEADMCGGVKIDNCIKTQSLTSEESVANLDFELTCRRTRGVQLPTRIDRVANIVPQFSQPLGAR